MIHKPLTCNLGKVRRDKGRFFVFENAASCGDCTVYVVDKRMNMEH